MSAIPLQTTRPLYDVEETAHDFKARQRSAYLAGKISWREGLISGQALQLYDELVRYVGANRCCWVKEETLADLLRRSVSTIKRWMQQLVDAHLIRRGRRFGLSSLTSITAYDIDGGDQEEDQAVVSTTPAAAVPAAQAEIPGSDLTGDTRESTTSASPAGPDAQPFSPTATGFFSSTNEPSKSSCLRRHTLSKPINLMGGSTLGRTAPIPSSAKTATTQRLEEEGIIDLCVLQELHDRPLGQIETVLRYVARCRRRDDPRRPGLIVYLIRQGFGMRQGLTPLATSAPPSILPAHVVGSPQPGEIPKHSRDSYLARSWQAALAELRPQLDEQEYTTWVHPNVCLLLEDELVVIGTPNVFVRDMVTQRYRGVIEAALSRQLEHAVSIELVIGTDCEEGGAASRAWLKCAST